MASRDWTVLTPIESEQALNDAKTATGLAWSELKQARLAELEATKAYKRARTALLLGGDCPRVGKGTTVADRDAWLDRETDAELWAYEGAKVITANAKDHLTVVRDQGSYVQSQHRSVQQAYQMVMSGAEDR